MVYDRFIGHGFCVGGEFKHRSAFDVFVRVLCLREHTHKHLHTAVVEVKCFRAIVGGEAADSHSDRLFCALKRVGKRGLLQHGESARHICINWYRCELAVKQRVLLACFLINHFISDSAVGIHTEYDIAEQFFCA